MTITSLSRKVSLSIALALAALAGQTTLLAATQAAATEQVSPAQQQFLVNYEAVRAALSEDDLTAAKAAAGKIDHSALAAAIVASPDLDHARTAFGHLSLVAVKMVHGHPGFYVMHCPMFRVDGQWAHWVQSNPTISNPYMGKMSPTCGSIMKDE